MEAVLTFFSEIHWAAVFQIIMIDILLGGDNAVVIALACRGLDPSQRTKGVIYGCAGAILLRVILIAFAVAIMNIPYLKFCGGLFLLWIGVKLLIPHEDGPHKVPANTKLWGAVKTIVLADIVMSLDNVIAIAGAAEQAPGHHQMVLVVFGLLVSVPFIICGSQIIMRIMDRFPIIVWAGGALLGWIAGGLIVDDPGVASHFPNVAELHWEGAVAGAVFVVAVAIIISYRKKNKQAEQEKKAEQAAVEERYKAEDSTPQA